MSVKYDFSPQLILWFGTDSKYYVRSGSTGKVVYSGSTYATVKNQATGSFTGGLYDATLNRLEGYTGSILASYYDMDNSIYSGSLYLGGVVSSIGITSGAMGSYSYIIYSSSALSGGPYFAKNADGNISYSGSNAATVINNAIGATINYGGKIVFKPGYYLLTAPIVIYRPNLILEGEVSGRFSVNTDGGVIFYTTGSSIDAIQISGSSFITNIHIKNIKFGNGDYPYPTMSGHGITNHLMTDTQSFYNSSIRNCFFQQYLPGKFAINIKNYENIVISECYLYNSGTGSANGSGLIHIYATGYSSSDLTIENCEIAPENSGSYCAIIESSPSAWTGSYSGDLWGAGRITFIRNHIVGGGTGSANGSNGPPRGVKIDAGNAGVQDIEFFRCIFEGMDIVITGSATDASHSVDRVLMTDSYMVADSNSYITTLLDIGTYSANTHLRNCHFWSNNTNTILIKNRCWWALYPTYLECCTFTGDNSTYIDTAGGYIEYGNNYGWTRTKNFGYQTITAASGSFTHGLYSTPINIYVQPSGSTYKGSLQTWPSGSAGIWVQQTGSGTVNFYWKAEM